MVFWLLNKKVVDMGDDTTDLIDERGFDGYVDVSQGGKMSRIIFNNYDKLVAIHITDDKPLSEYVFYSEYHFPENEQKKIYKKILNKVAVPLFLRALTNQSELESKYYVAVHVHCAPRKVFYVTISMEDNSSQADDQFVSQETINQVLDSMAKRNTKLH